jgi:hypothetical protein
MARCPRCARPIRRPLMPAPTTSSPSAV